MLDAIIDDSLLDELLDYIKERAAKGIHTPREAKLLADLDKIEAANQAKMLQIEANFETYRATMLRESITAALEARFGSVPDSVYSGLANVTEANRLETLIRLAATCPNVDEFAAAL